ncbi:MAG: hypothetical protein ACI9XZ_003896 [Alphaproteobacteria bacterium]|jgi:hypothetical protein
MVGALQNQKSSDSRFGPIAAFACAFAIVELDDKSVAQIDDVETMLRSAAEHFDHIIGTTKFATGLPARDNLHEDAGDIRSAECLILMEPPNDFPRSHCRACA